MLFNSLPCQLHGPLIGQVSIRRISAFNPVKSSRMEHFNDPAKFKMHIDYAMKKLRELIPDSVQHFPWAKAESTAMGQLLMLGQEAFKWSLTAFFILSFVSDIINSISRNKELFIPFGLFCGCVVADFLKETSHEYFHYSQVKDSQFSPFSALFLNIFAHHWTICLTGEGQELAPFGYRLLLCSG